MESRHCVATPFVVITGLDPVIHALLTSRSDKNVDGRVKPGHDEDTAERSHSPYEGQPSKDLLLRPRQRKTVAVGVEAGHARCSDLQVNPPRCQTLP